MALTPKGDAARALLASLPEFSGGDKSVGALSDAYAQRLASAAQRQLASGVTPSRQAARGHVLTPEHPRSAPPKLPEQPSTYKRVRKTLRDTSLQPEAPSRPSQRRTGALTGERRSILHKRERGESHVPFSATGEIYTRNSERAAREVLRYAADLNNGHGERVVLQVFDCSRNKWFQVFRNAGHGQGINVNALLEQWRDHGGSLEEFLMAVINDDGSDPNTGRIGHICQYEITILPRPTAAVKTLQQTLRQGGRH